MRLATLRRGETTVAARIDADNAVPIRDFRDLSQLLVEPEWATLAAAATGSPIDLATAEYAPVVPRPSKIVCVGLNYGNHIKEMGRELPHYPTLFAKFAEALIGAYDEILVPDYADGNVDWEGELAVVMGKQARRVTADDALGYIAGYSVANDVTMRDYQYRTQQWLQGKTFEATCPLGPTLVTTDEFDGEAMLNTYVDDVARQTDTTSDLVFTPAKLVEYISQILTLQPGDVVLTGTPGGVGHPRQSYLRDGSVLRTEIDGLGAQRNTVRVHSTESAASMTR
ncbi:fumarylacetoacetate hydrolase family protein [Williamsia muralis]|uniref:fumarylacetoacetate hydrolase family protein n=1 Tax=Williamsia marianensis TaxID=85044 RepID=UPI003824B0AB